MARPALPGKATIYANVKVLFARVQYVTQNHPIQSLLKIHWSVDRQYYQWRNEVAMEGPAQVNTEDDFAFCLPNSGVYKGAISRHKNLTFASIALSVFKRNG